MTEQKDGLFRVFTGWVEKKFGSNEGFIITQTSNPRSLKDAMEFAKNAEGWVEKDGEPAHVENGTPVKLK